MSNIIGRPANPTEFEGMLKEAFRNSLPIGVTGKVKDIQITPDGSVSIRTEVCAPAALDSINFMEFSVDGSPAVRFSMKNYLECYDKIEEKETSPIHQLECSIKEHDQNQVENIFRFAGGFIPGRNPTYYRGS